MPPHGISLLPSVGEYPVYDEAIYRVLTDDARRNELFGHAVRAAAPAAVVLEVGCGADPMWSLAAADAGAARVYAIEAIPGSARQAQQAADARGDGRIHVIAGDSTRIALPERAEVCIAEIVGCIGGAEGIAAVLADAWRRHLAPSAVVIPSAVRTLAGVVGLVELADGDLAMPAAMAPYTEAVFRHAGAPFDLRLYVTGVGPDALLSTAGPFETLDLGRQSYAQGGALRLEITRNGRADGLLAWIELKVDPGDELLNSLTEETNWLPVYIPFTRHELLPVSAGDVLSLNVTVGTAADGIHPEYFFAGQLTRPGSTVEVSAESRYSGGPFRATAVHQTLFSHLILLIDRILTSEATMHLPRPATVTDEVRP
jgi:type I protein arginine methyltransferase